MMLFSLVLWGLQVCYAMTALYLTDTDCLEDVPDHISLWQLRLAICQPLQQYANVRPVCF